MKIALELYWKIIFLDFECIRQILLNHCVSSLSIIVIRKMINLSFWSGYFYLWNVAIYVYLSPKSRYIYSQNINHRIKFNLIRFYTNANVIVDEVLGKRGPNRVHQAKLDLIKNKIKLAQKKIEAKVETNQDQLRHLKRQRRVLQLEILHVFTVICTHYYETMTMTWYILYIYTCFVHKKPLCFISLKKNVVKLNQFWNLFSYRSEVSLGQTDYNYYDFDTSRRQK